MILNWVFLLCAVALLCFLVVWLHSLRKTVGLLPFYLLLGGLAVVLLICVTKNLPAGSAGLLVALLLGFARDLTVRSREMAQARDEFEQLKQWIDRMPGVFLKYSLRPDGSSCFPFLSNQIREACHVTSEARDASSVLALLHPDDYDAVIASIQESARTLAVWKMEFRIKSAEGTVRWLSGEASPSREPDGSTLWCGVCCDVSDLKRGEDRLRLFAQHLETLREDERKNVARELHDDVGQVLTALKIDLQFVEQHAPFGPALKKQIDDMKTILSDAIPRVRSLGRRLRPAALDDLCLEDALAGLAEEWQSLHDVVCDCGVDVDDARLSPEVKTVVFRMVQEALSNVIRHARASQVKINVVSDERTLHVSIADDGRGAEPRAVRRSASFGLFGLRERIEILGGALTVKSTPEKGFRIEGVIPLGYSPSSKKSLA